MKILSAQQIFNKVSKHLLTQNKRVHENGRGEWVGKNGELCASACLIKPSLRKGLANHDYWVHSRSLLDSSGVDLELHWDLVNDLTETLDKHKPSRWPRRLRAIAKRFELKVPEYLKNA